MRFIISLVVSVILATAPLGAAAAVVTDAAQSATMAMHAAHAKPAADKEPAPPACRDASCPDDHHKVACATQTTHCKISGDHCPAAGVGLIRIADAMRWRVAHNAGVGDEPELDLPPPRF